MTCAPDDLLCLSLEWISHNEFTILAFADFLGTNWKDTGGLIGLITHFIDKYGQFTIGLLGGGYGILKWWRYREAILHKRLSEYLQEQEHQLSGARQALVSSIMRPTPGQSLQIPLFTVSQLKRVFREDRWWLPNVAKAVASSANADLDKALVAVENRIETAQSQLNNFRSQRATIHLLRGAVAAAQAKDLPIPKSIGQDRLALIQFRTARQVPGHEQDIEALEFEAHQWRRLGHLEEANNAYRDLETSARNIRDKRRRDLMVSRAKFFQALILQVLALQAFLGNSSVNGGAANANTKLNEAQLLRAPYGPFHSWDSIEQGHLHWTRALVYNRLGFKVMETQQLESSESSYTAVLAEIPQKTKLNGPDHYLREAAASGMARVRDARSGKYDMNWLFPPEIASEIALASRDLDDSQDDT